MNKQIQINTAKNGQSHFTIKAKNGRILCHSETYSSPAKCRQGLEALRQVILFGPGKQIIKKKAATRKPAK